jgi:hypothetical protein
MKYFAAVGSENEMQAVIVQPPVNMLCSYHYFKKHTQLIKSCVDKNFDIFIDSGAFSAMSLNKEINIDEYCKFIIDTGARTYAGLDVIGNAAQTRANNEYMIKQYGLKPIPTFHLGSNIDDLAALMDYSYIALGGLVFSSGVTDHCDKVWAYILKNNPRLKVHGFGLTNFDLMARYPWYSVDSSSYKGCRRFGRQTIMWNNFDFKTFEELDYIKILRTLGHDVPDPVKYTAEQKAAMTAEEKAAAVAANTKRYFLYDYYSVQSYKLYGALLKEVNKIKKFDYLTAQGTLFD